MMEGKSIVNDQIVDDSSCFGLWMSARKLQHRSFNNFRPRSLQGDK